jgi:hypothetical protein
VVVHVAFTFGTTHLANFSARFGNVWRKGGVALDQLGCQPAHLCADGHQLNAVG